MPYKLTVKQRKAAILMAEGELDIDIQQRLSMRSGTLDRWRRIPLFMEVLHAHLQNMQQVAPYRKQLMQTMSIAAACAELAFRPEAKHLQQVGEIIKQTAKLSDLEMGAVALDDPQVTDATSKVIEQSVSELTRKALKLSENTPISLKLPETRRNDLKCPEMCLTNPESAEI